MTPLAPFRRLALAAGRMLLRRPDDAGLIRIASAHLATDTPQQLADSIASGNDILFATLEAAPDATPLARIDFVLSPSQGLVIEHTEVDPSLKGQGLGARLVAAVAALSALLIGALALATIVLILPA